MEGAAQLDRVEALLGELLPLVGALRKQHAARPAVDAASPPPPQQLPQPANPSAASSAPPAALSAQRDPRAAGPSPDKLTC